MGQKTHPIGFRIAITEPWRSRWFANKKDFATFLKEDQKIREYIKKNCYFAAVPKVEIERVGGTVTVTIHTARPGRLIGKKGSEVDQLRESLEKLTGRMVRLKIQEIHRPELEAVLVAESIGEQLIKRQGFRRAIKKAIESSMAAGAQGVKVRVAGRLGGADMARTEVQKEGRVPLQTLRAQIDYGLAVARTTYGVIGVQVWIFRGELEPGEKTLGLKPIRQIQPSIGRSGGTRPRRRPRQRPAGGAAGPKADPHPDPGPSSPPPSPSAGSEPGNSGDTNPSPESGS
ncbi:MAG TPA: 30S ribosomal protein S3 [Planctomycetes bacterium]|nr:30S ribosomal protein S3 [Planctomycetota bacterium]